MKIMVFCALLAGCGADVDAPSPTNAPMPATCPTLEELAPELLGLVRGARLPGIQALVRDQLTEAQITTLLDTLLRILRGLPAAERDALLALGHDPRLQQLLPTVADLLAFVAGDGQTGYRGEVIADVRRLLRTCDGERLFTALDRLLAAPALPRLLAALGDALALDIVQAVLNSDEPLALRRPGFTTLVCNLVASIVWPDFDVQADIIRPLSGITLLPFDEPPLATLLDALAELLSPEAGVLAPLADTVCCDVYGVSRCGALPADARPLPRDPVFTWLLYDLFTTGELDVTGLLTQVATLATDPTLIEALAPVAALLREVGADPDLRTGLVALLATALQDDIARQVLPELVLLLRTAALPELLAVADALLNGCEVR
ncbi:MAG: hypothetical protein KC549_02555 [Myxococcales bacterium]|nr:hypothetical protein [Myxococcales bacterium]